MMGSDQRLRIELTLAADGQAGIEVEGPASDDLTAVLGLIEFCKLRIMAESGGARQPAPEQQQRQQPGSITPGRFVPDFRGNGRP